MGIKGITNSTGTNSYQSVKDSTKSQENISFSELMKASKETLMEQLKSDKEEMTEKLKNGETQPTYQIGGQSFTVDEWEKMLKKVDHSLDELRKAAEAEAKKAQEEQKKEDGKTEGITEDTTEDLAGILS